MALGLALGVAITQFAVTVMRVRGDSMLPNLKDGSLVVVVRPPLVRLLELHAGEAGQGSLSAGDVVVVLDPLDDGRAPYVKRVIALGGQSVELQDGVTIVNDEVLPEPWLAPQHRGASTFPRSVLPPASIFVLGDNRLPLASRDSRAFGPVPKALWRGRVTARLTSPVRDGGGLRSPFAPVGSFAPTGSLAPEGSLVPARSLAPASSFARA